MKIFTNETRNHRKGPEAWFTGTVWIEELLRTPEPASVKTNRVSFEPGARTAWHTHPHGQGLHVLEGLGYVQFQGQPPQTIRPGDSVWIEAGEVHWHGAAPGHRMVHLAIQQADGQGIDAVWLEHVTDQEYGNL